MADLRNVPWSPEAEKAVLGGLMLSDTAFEAIADRLRAEDFFYRPHGVVFGAISELAGQGKPRDVVTVYEHLAEREQADDIGGLAFVGTLANEAGSAANVRAYAEIIRTRSLYRQLIGVATDVLDSLYDRQDMPVTEQMDYAESRLLEVHNLLEGGAQQGPVVMREAYERALQNINDLADRGTTLTGLDTGLRELNRMTAGLQPGNLIVIAGRPAMGKTALATQISGQAAVRGGGCALFFSLEMPPPGQGAAPAGRELLDRRFAQHHPHADSHPGTPPASPAGAEHHRHRLRAAGDRQGRAQRHHPRPRGGRDQPRAQGSGQRTGRADHRAEPAQPRVRAPGRQAPDDV